MGYVPETLSWIDRQAPRMCRWVQDWAAINSYSYNVPGLMALAARVAQAAAGLGARPEQVSLAPAEAIDDQGQSVRRPLGAALVLRQRPKAPRQVLLAIHLDTVYPPDHSFQKTEFLDANTLRGPGVVDAKGGLAVMLAALEAFERTPVAQGLGWQVILNPDEEVGSPSSRALLAEAARGRQVGLIFEPAMAGGSLVGARKGSGHFALVVRGKAAHVGRDFAAGASAVHALGQAVVRLAALNRLIPGATVNVGRVLGGGPANVVADLALARCNVRVQNAAQQERLERELAAVAEELSGIEGIRAQWHGGFFAPPKPLDAATQMLLEQAVACGRELGLNLDWQPSGGVCDGNRLAAAGLPTLDSLGPRGADIHSPNERLFLDSLTERAKLTALLLIKYASGELVPPGVRNAEV